MRQDFSPPITHFVIFSGGGGLIEREESIALLTGENLLQLRGVPASFDQDSLLIDLGDQVTLKQIGIRKPSKQYVEDILKREGAAARQLIASSADVGTRRGEIIDICEAIANRSYVDEEVDISLRLHCQEAGEYPIHISYFINDSRFRWKPTITVELIDGKAHIRGMIAIENESSHHFEDVEVSFADFAHQFSDDAGNFRALPEQRRKRMKKQVMKNMMFK